MSKRGRTPNKQAEWSARLARYEQSNLTVASFCAAEGVAEQTFYQWRRRFREQGKDVPAMEKASVQQQAFQPLDVAQTDVAQNDGAEARCVVIRMPGGAAVELRDAASIDQLLTEMRACFTASLEARDACYR